MNWTKYLVLTNILKTDPEDAYRIWGITHEEALTRLNELVYDELVREKEVDEKGQQTGDD